MTQLYLIRHAESDLNVQGRFSGLYDCDITARGKSQIESLRKYIKSKGIKTCYCSPLKRAYKTALGVSDSPIVVQDLHEMDFGDVDGLKIATLGQTHPDLMKKLKDLDPDLKFPNGESKSDLLKRVSLAIDDILSKDSSEKIAAVCHSLVISAYISHILTDSTDLIWRLELENCSVTKVKIFDNKTVLSYLNRIPL